MPQTLARDQLHVSVDLLILTVHKGRLCLLLGQRPEEPFQGCWALPGCLLGREESSEEAARRLLREMLPLPDCYLEQLYTFTAPGRDPRGRVISTAYLVIAPWTKLAPLLDAPGMRLVPFVADPAADPPLLTSPGGEELAPAALAFDHGEIIRTGLKRLRGKLDYTHVGFRFLSDPEAFPLSELQTVFEAVLGHPLDSSNFRRAILGRYEAEGYIAQTERSVRQGRGRPAVLYRIAGRQ